MTGSKNFADIPRRYTSFDGAAIVVLSAPCDRTSTWLKGSAKAPAAIIDASANMELYDIETDFEVYRKGIHTAKPLSLNVEPARMVDIVRRRTAELLEEGKLVVVLGGEHSVSIGAIAAHCAKYPGLTVLQLDAHADLRDAYQGSKFNHACVMARAKEMAAVVQVGIRSMDAGEKGLLDIERTFFAKDIYDNTDWIDRAVARLGGDVYVTIDLDVFDPSVMPSVGTPEPGGLLWYNVLAFLKRVARSRNVIGFDVTELCPNPANKAADFLAAKLIYKLLGYIYTGRI